MQAAQLTLSKEPDREEIIVNAFFVIKVALQYNNSSWRRFFLSSVWFSCLGHFARLSLSVCGTLAREESTLVLTLSNLIPLGNINHYANQKSYNRGTQPLFSVKYLLGEANIAKDYFFYYLRTAKAFQMTVLLMYNFRSSSNKFSTIFGSLIFHISPPRLGNFFIVKGRPNNLKFFDSKM